MPSPIIHSLTGYLMAHKTAQTQGKGLCRIVILIGLAVIASNLPDLDYLPGLLMGNLKLFHHGMTHSLTFSVIFGVLMGLLLHRAWQWRFRKGFVLFSWIYASHIGLDLLGKDHSYPYGMQLLWPFSTEYYISPVTFFPGLINTGVWEALSLANLRCVGIEMLLFLPIVLWVFRRSILTILRARFLRDWRKDPS
jgi:inner membrane protein